MKRSDWGPPPDVATCWHDMTPPEYRWWIYDESAQGSRPVVIQECRRCGVVELHQLDALSDIA